VATFFKKYSVLIKGNVWEQGSISPTFFFNSFYTHISQKPKKTVKLSVFFALSGSACAKAARRMLMKLTPVALKYDVIYKRPYATFLLLPLQIANSLLGSYFIVLVFVDKIFDFVKVMYSQYWCYWRESFLIKETKCHNVDVGQ